MPSGNSLQPPKKRLKQSGQKRAPYVATACDSWSSKTLLRTIDELQLQLSAVKSQLSVSSSLVLDNVSREHLFSEDTTAEHVSTAESRLRKLNRDHEYYYAGPTSSTYSLNTANSRLLDVGESRDQQHISVGDQSAHIESFADIQSPEVDTRSTDQHTDPLLMEVLTLEETDRCIDTFQEVFGVLHPIFTMQKIKSQAPQLLRAARRSLRSRPSEPGDCGMLEMFKCILATGLVCIEGSPTPLSRALYQSLEPVIGDAVFSRTISHEFRILLLLVALYHFSCDDLAMGTRALMIASRTAVEAGLYRRARLEAVYPEDIERNSVVNLLWSLFVLDMQFNFAAGLPNIMNEQHVDLPRPVDAPYLAAMVEYVLLGAQGWQAIVGKDVLTSGKSPSEDALGFFRYQLNQWQQRLHPTVRFDVASIEENDDFFHSSDVSDTSVYLKTLLYLRSNQIQILILRPILMHSQSAQREVSLAKEAVRLARNSIRTLCQLATTPEMYDTRKTVFNHFLGSSLAVLFMAAAHDAERRTQANDTGASQALLDNAEVLREGLDLVDQSHATRLIRCFERPRSQLARLRILGTQRTEGTQDHGSQDGTTSYTSLPETTYRENTLPTSFDFAADDLLLDDNVFNMDWFDDPWTQPSAPFGIPSWM